jgi:hypothetical protein
MYVMVKVMWAIPGFGCRVHRFAHACPVFVGAMIDQDLS